MSTTKELSSMLAVLQDEYRVRKEKLKECESNINFLIEKIYHTCVHGWIVDVSSSDDRTVFICTHCGLNKR